MPQFQNLDARLAEWKSQQPLKPDDEKRLWRKLLLDWNYHSNRIEGNTLTYGETELLLIHGTASGDHELRHYNEMQAHDVAIRHLRQMAKEDRPISEGDIRDLNRILLKEPFWKEAITQDGKPTRKEIIPGEYKTVPNNVRTAGGDIFPFADPVDVPLRIGDLVTWLRSAMEKGELHPLEIASKLHHDFVLIHPFDDGNGRTARLLVNYVLMRSGYLPLIVPTERKDSYLAALRLADAGDLTTLTARLTEWAEISLDRGIRAAKGESIEDPDDLAKEIELFKRRQTQSSRAVISKSPAGLLELYRTSFLPLFEDFENSLRTLDPLFSKTGIVFTNGSKRSEAWRGALETWAASQSGQGNLRFQLDFKGYKGPAPEVFNASAFINLTFSEFEYQLESNGSQRIKHLYAEPLDKTERDLIVRSALADAFSSVKRQSGGDI